MALGSASRLAGQLLLVALVAVSCAAEVSPRQATRTTTAPVSLPAVESPGAVYTVQRGAVVDEYVLGGTVEVRSAVPVAAPVGGVASGLVALGAEVAAGDVLFSVTPSSEAVLAATELEAALLAQRLGEGDAAELDARVSAATAAAEALGLPTGADALGGAPEQVAVTSPASGTVVAVYRTDEEVVPGQVIMEVGDAGDLVVRAPLRPELAGRMHLGASLGLTAEGASGNDAPAGVVQEARPAAGGRTVLTLEFPADSAAADYAEGTDVTVVGAGDGDMAGTVDTATTRPDGSVEVHVLLEDQPFALGETVAVAPRDGGEVVSAAVSQADLDPAGEPRLTLEVPDAGLPLRSRVTVAVVGSSLDNVLWLPPEAIRSFAGERFVLVDDDGTRTRVAVTEGLHTPERVEVVGDLEAGQRVVGP